MYSKYFQLFTYFQLYKWIFPRLSRNKKPTHPAFSCLTNCSRFGYFGVKLLLDASTMADDGSILAEEKEEAEEAVNESLPEWVTNLALPTLVIQAGHGWSFPNIPPWLPQKNWLNDQQFANLNMAIDRKCSCEKW